MRLALPSISASKLSTLPGMPRTGADIEAYNRMSVKALHRIPWLQHNGFVDAARSGPNGLPLFYSNSQVC